MCQLYCSRRVPRSTRAAKRPPPHAGFGRVAWYNPKMRLTVYAESNRPNDFKVGGVVSGYRNGFADVMKVSVIDKNSIKPADVALNRILEMPDGTFRKLTPTGQVLTDNTGIV